MPLDTTRTLRALARLLERTTPEALLARLKPDRAPLPPRVRHSARFDTADLDRRAERAGLTPAVRAELADPQTRGRLDAYARNIESIVGTVKVPVGLAGPLRVNGSAARGDYLVPLATTEAALVASYSRGAGLVSEAGGATAVVMSEAILRAPAFAFADLGEAGQFVDWITRNLDPVRAAAEATTRFGRLVDLTVTVEGNHVYLGFVYETGDAAGQNIATSPPMRPAAISWSTRPSRPAASSWKPTCRATRRPRSSASCPSAGRRRRPKSASMPTWCAGASIPTWRR